MTNIQIALSSAGLQNQIKVSTSVSQTVLGVSYPPSAGAFSSASQPFMGPILQFLASTVSPLLVNVYPYFAYAGDPLNIGLDYALFTSPKPIVFDSQFSYSNIFYAIVDSVYSAFEKIGVAQVGFVVSEMGWPSAGGTATTIENTQTCWSGDSYKEPLTNEALGINDQMTIHGKLPVRRNHAVSPALPWEQ